MPTQDNEPHTVTMNCKDGKVEQEMDMGMQGLVKTYCVHADHQKKYYLVMESMKMGMTTEDSDQASNPTADTVLAETGKQDTIAGHVSNEYTVKIPDGSLSLWATPDFSEDVVKSISNAMLEQPHQDEASQEAFEQLAKKGLTPVKVIATVDGQVAQSLVFVKYETKKLDDALFVPTTDIKYRPMPTGMGGGGTN